jgi:hypothetical protein
MTGSPPPDPIEKRIRFGCGMLFGIFLLGVSLLKFVESSLPPWYYLATGSGSVLIGLLAMRMGDDAYRKLGNFFRWW